VEGSTDFLWFLALAGLRWIGMSVGVGAVMLGALGVFASVFVFVRHACVTRFEAGLAGLLVLLQHGSLSALQGFSTQLFGAGVLIGTLWGLHGRALRLLWLALFVALLRPEGYFVALGFVGLGFLHARREGRLRGFLLLAAGLLLVWLGYMYWHYLYFGLLAPLSVYVKSQGAGFLPGLGRNFKYLHIEAGPLVFFLVLAVGAWFGRRRFEWKGLLPLGLLLVPLSFALQSQNVQWRFQAPVFLVVAFLALRFLHGGQGKRMRVGLATGLFLLACLPSFFFGGKRLVPLLRGEPALPMQSFAPVLGDALGREGRLALSEAGGFSYYSNCETVDLVGLNTKRFAMRAASAGDLEGFRPDVFVGNVRRQLSEEAIARIGGRSVLEVAGEDVLAMTRKGASQGEDEVSSLVNAARALLGFAAGADGYALRFVRNGRDVLLMGFRSSWDRSAPLLAELDRCAELREQPSYLDLQGR